MSLPSAPVILAILAVSLIDAATQWHRVGLISGENREQAQPLLAPLYYIQRALKPYAELAITNDSNLVSKSMSMSWST